MPLIAVQPSNPALQTFLCDSPEQVEQCRKIRVEVFVTEQGYDLGDEIDDKEEGSDHLLLLYNGIPTGTIRYYPPMSKLGRLAVLRSARGIGAGKVLVEALEEHLKSRTGKSAAFTEGKKEVDIVANAQKYVEVFYNRLGYVTEGPDFLEEGQPHVKVVKKLQL
ncbi:acetyltransferase GNAT family [Pseudohyphozyma bogoriensis]|nr:acetyltransferase GNAT family [Pseudohyphozyma bogoriensis]